MSMNLHVSSQRATDDLLTQPNLRLRIGEHVVDIGALRVVTQPDVPRLTGKAVAVLIELVRHAGATVTRDELLDRVWTGRFPTPDVLTQAIKELRRAFADDSKPSRYIETVPKVGYRLIARVLVLDGPEPRIFVDESIVQTLGDDAATLADTPPGARTIIAPRPSFFRKQGIWVVPLLVAVAVGLAIAVLAARGDLTGNASEPMWQVTDLHALTSDPGAEYRPHLSPDGALVAYSIFDQKSRFESIVLRSLQPSQVVHLTSGGVEALPVWSPDGTRISFERLGPNYCEMILVPSLGGSERDIGKCPGSQSRYDWTPDGRSLISAQRQSAAHGDLTLFKWNLDSGKQEFLDYQRTANDQDLNARYSPDGQRIAFQRGLPPYSDLYVMSSAGGAVRQVTHLSARIFGHAWMSDNRTLIFSFSQKGAPALYAIDVDSGRMQALGISPAKFPDAARSGAAVVYEITRAQDKLKERSLAAAASSRVLAPSTGSDYSPVLSPSGDRVVFTSDRSGQFQVWLLDRRSGTVTPLTENVEIAVFSARWSADGNKVVAVQSGAKGRQLIEIDVARHRQRVLSKPGEHIIFGDYGVDPDSYLFAIGKADRNARLLQVDHPGTARESRKLLVSGIAHAQVSAKTRSVYYTTYAATGLFRRDLDGGKEQLVTSKITSDLINGWQLVDGHIWYLGDFGLRTAVLRDFDPASGEDRVVTRLNVLLKDVSFSVTPDHASIIFAPVDVEDTDIGMFRLHRTGRP